MTEIINQFLNYENLLISMMFQQELELLHGFTTLFYGGLISELITI